MRQFLDRLYAVSGGLGALFILLILLLMIGQSVLREFGVKTGAVNDVVAWFCAAASFFSMAHAFKHGDFVRVTLLLDSLSVRQRHLMEIASLLLGTVAVSYLAYWANRFCYESWIYEEKTQGLLAIPIWIPQASFALGSLILLVAVLDELVLVLGGSKPSYVTAIEARHAQGDFSSDI